MSNKFFHLALSAIAPLAVISTVAFVSPAVALPEIEPTKITATHPDPVTPSAVNSNPAVSRGITLTISPEALIIAIITLMFIAGAVSHRKYKRQRVLTLQEQIQLLEKIWRMTPQR